MSNLIRHSFIHINYIIYMILSLIPLLFLAPQARAVDKFILIPFVETEYQFDTNYYKSDQEERKVTSLTFKPGIKFGYHTARSAIELNSFLTSTSYNDQDSNPQDLKSSDENDYTGHNLALSAKTALFTRITTGITDTWINTRNPSETDEFANSVSVDEYSINRINPWLKYTITDRLAFFLAYGNIDIDYANGSVEDSNENSGTLKLYYSLSKFTTLDLEYKTWTMDYNLTSSDYTSNQYSLNMETQFKYFGFTAGVGFHTRDFNDSTLDNLETPVWHIGIKGQNPPDKTEPRPRSHFELTYAENFNNTGSGNEYYTANRVTLTAGKLFMEKLDLGISAYFQKTNYENYIYDRDDDTWFFSTTLDYLVKEWLILTLETGYETRQSTLSIDDYDNSYVLCKINFNYNFGSR